MLEGNRGLLFTDESPEVVLEWFESYKKQDFARTGNTVDETFELPEGTFPSYFHPPSSCSRLTFFLSCCVVVPDIQVRLKSTKI
jgi:hypothetical protein